MAAVTEQNMTTEADTPGAVSVFHGKMIPRVAEAHGRLAPMAEALTSYIIAGQVKVIEGRQGCSPSSALRQASGKFWEHLSGHWLTAGWLGIAHCARSFEVAACQPRRPPEPAGCQADPAILI